LTGRKISFGNVVALDVQSILSKSKISGVGFVERACDERIEDPSQNSQRVPVKVFFSDASIHDTYYVDEFLEDIKKCNHVVVDRAFSDFEFMVKLWKRGVSFTTRTKRNASFDFVDGFVDGDVLVKRYVRVG